MVPLLQTDSEGEEEEDSLSDREILNVIRRSDEKVLKTSEIAEPLSITPNWTGKRLNKLESEGRVHSKSAGRGRVWWLDEAETGFPVPDGLNDFMWYCFLADRASLMVLLTGVGMFAISGVLLLPILAFNIAPGLETTFFSSQGFANTAMLAAVVAGFLLIVGGAFKLFVVSLRQSIVNKE